MKDLERLKTIQAVIDRDMKPGMAAKRLGMRSCDSVDIARQSTWQGRVNQDGKGSRGIQIMPLMFVAGKRYVEG
jgi:hypothetical protein